jgi:ribosomal-protein-alanine N-acetyltransferase
MNSGDLDRVVAIETLSFPTPWSRNAFESELDNDFALYLVAETDGLVIGYAGMWVIMDEGHITNVAVHPEHRGCRTAKSLLLKLIGWGVLRGVRRVTLEVRPSNRAALNLYYRMGFVPAGRRKGYYSDTGEDAVIMWHYLGGRSTRS